MLNTREKGNLLGLYTLALHADGHTRYSCRPCRFHGYTALPCSAGAHLAGGYWVSYSRLWAIALLAGTLTLSDGDVSGGLIALVLGLLMLWAGWPLVRRGQLPMLAVLSPAGLRLEPRDRSISYGRQPVDYALADMTGYSELTSQAGTQIKLYTASKQVLQLADRPAKAVPAAEAELPGLVDVVALGQEIQQRLAVAGVAPASIYRPNFYQGKLAKALLWLCYGLMLLGVVLVFVPGVEWTVGLRLLVFPSMYLGAYQSNQRRAAPAPAAETA